MKHPLFNSMFTIIGGLLALPAVAGYSFTNLSPPGTTYMNVYSINDSGQVTGWYGDATTDHGFVESGGSFTTLNVPGASVTQAISINASGKVAGRYSDASGTHGFVESGGAFTTLNAPGSFGTVVTSINASGQVAGWYLDASGNSYGFVATPAVPEPKEYMLLLLGFGMVAYRVKLKNRQSA